jgi:hypothetical protein
MRKDMVRIKITKEVVKNTSSSALHLLSRWFLAQLIYFDPEDGGDVFLRNVG